MKQNRAFDVPCRISIEQSEESFHAHVELESNIAIYPGDRVRVHGDPICIAFGQSVVLDRIATVVRAGPLMRSWTKLAAYFDLSELYEVSFNPGSIK
jgi:hypothetical protein